MNGKVKILQLLVMSILFLIPVTSCKPQQSVERLVDANAVKQIRTGMSEKTMLQILSVPPKSVVSDNVSVMSYPKATIRVVWWYTWHYDADKNLILSTMDGKVSTIDYMIRLD